MIHGMEWRGGMGGAHGCHHHHHQSYPCPQGSTCPQEESGGGAGLPWRVFFPPCSRCRPLFASPGEGKKRVWATSQTVVLPGYSTQTTPPLDTADGAHFQTPNPL